MVREVKGVFYVPNAVIIQVSLYCNNFAPCYHVFFPILTYLF